LAVEQQWEAFESSRQTIAILTSKLNAHEEKLNRRVATTETAAYKARQVTAPTTNNDDKEKKKNGEESKVLKCGKKGHIAGDCHKKNIRTAIRRNKKRFARMWKRMITTNS